MFEKGPYEKYMFFRKCIRSKKNVFLHIQGPPVINFCLNFGIFLAEVHKAISHGAVLQKELKGADEKVVMDSDYADDLAVMDNTEEGL